MSLHRYKAKSLIGDYARSGFGLICVGVPYFVGELSGFVGYAFIALALLFIIYGARTVLRQLTVYNLDDMGIRTMGGWPAGIAWGELQAMDLRYFSTRRDRQGGWMHLRLTDSEGKIGFDSALDGFDAIVAAAYTESRRVGVALNERTVNNLQSFGIALVPAVEDPRPESPQA